MARKTRKTTAVAIPVETPETVETTVAAETAIDTTAAETAVDTTAAETAIAPFSTGTYRITSPDGAASFPVPVSPWIARTANALRGLHAITAATPDALFDARVAHVRNGFDAHGTPVDWTTMPQNRAADTASNVTETQNAIYAAFALAGVPATSAMVTAAWRALIPVTKCDFRSHASYGFSTFADFVGGRHGNIPGVPPGSWSTFVARWYVANGIVRGDWTVVRVNDDAAM